MRVKLEMEQRDGAVSELFAFEFVLIVGTSYTLKRIPFTFFHFQDKDEFGVEKAMAIHAFDFF